MFPWPSYHHNHNTPISGKMVLKLGYWCICHKTLPMRKHWWILSSIINKSPFSCYWKQLLARSQGLLHNVCHKPVPESIDPLSRRLLDVSHIVLNNDLQSSCWIFRIACLLTARFWLAYILLCHNIPSIIYSMKVQLSTVITWFNWTKY